jgi:hypothetical protein
LLAALPAAAIVPMLSSQPVRLAVAFGLVTLVTLVIALLRPRVAAFMTVLFLLALVARQPAALLSKRSFFGVYAVRQTPDFRSLSHGTTLHGMQSRDPAERDVPLSYYARTGPLGDVFSTYQLPGRPLRMADIGLGVGTLATYGRAGDSVTFFEIDPVVVGIARDPSLFTFLTDAHAATSIVVGDARLRLGKVADGSYDLMVIDAFTSDSVPVHLLTQEAFALYRSKLAPDGILVVHISNRFLDLEPEVQAVSASAGMQSLTRTDTTFGPPDGKVPSTYVVASPDAARLAQLAAEPGWNPSRSKPNAGWTDAYSSIIRTLK